MAVTTAVLSGNIADLGLDIETKYLSRVVLVVESNTAGSLLRDTFGNTLLAGAKRVTVDKSTGAFSQTFVTTNSADIVPAADRLYKATLIYPSGHPGAGNDVVSSGWFAFTADATLADVWQGIEVTAVSTAVYASISNSVTAAQTAETNAETAQAAAEAARDDAVDISNISTSDAVVEALVKNTGGAGPLTSAALSATYADKTAVNTFTAGTQRFTKNDDPAIGPEHHFEGYNGAWGYGIDVAATIQSRDWVPVFKKLNKARTFADGATTNGSPTLTSATANFGSVAVGRTITGAGIPGGTTILSVQSRTSATLSANATATATGVSFTIGAGSGVNDIIYVSDNGYRGPSVGIGKPQPDDLFRLQVQAEAADLDQGALRLRVNVGQTADQFIVDADTIPSAFRLTSAGRMRHTASGTTRTAADGATTNASTTLTATLDFTDDDKGRYITGIGIPVGTYIAGVTNATTVTLSQAATATATGLSVTLYVPSTQHRTAGFVPQVQTHPGSGTTVTVLHGLTSLGTAPRAVPTSTVQINTPTGTDATFAMGTNTGNGSFRLIAYDASALVELRTQNASELALATNGTKRIRIGATGSLHFDGGTPVAKPTLPAAATDLATALTLVNAIRSDALIARGLAA